MRKVGAKLFTFFGYFIATVIIVVAVFVSISALITPVFNKHITDIESWMSVYTNSPVQIDNIEFSWYGYEPQIILNQVTVLDKESHKPRLEIRRLRVDISLWRSFWAWNWEPENFVVAGVRLSVYQQTSGQINVQGILGFNMKDTLTGASVKVDELYKQIFNKPRIALRDIDILYYPAKGGVNWLTLHDLTLQSSDSDHTLTGNVILHQEIPTKVQINYFWKGDLRDFSTVDAKLYFYVEGVSLAQWLGKTPCGGFQVQQGLATAKIWVDWNKNQWQKMQSSFQLYDIELKSLATQKSQVIERLRGDLGWKKDGDKQTLAGEQIFIDFPDHLWQGTDFYLNYKQTAEGSYQPLSTRIDYLDLDDVKRIVLASNLISEDVRKLLSTYNPTGDLYKVDMEFNGASIQDPSKTTLTMGFANLGFKGSETIPSADNLTGEFNWNGTSGDLKLNSQDADFFIKNIFSHPLVMDRVTGELSFQKNDKDVWTLKTNKLSLANADLNASVDMALTMAPNVSPVINLSANFQVPQVAHITNYLPMKIFDPDLVEWLNNAFKSGELQNGTAILQGKLADYPFDHAPGNFMVSATVKGIDLNFAPGWPILNDTTGTLLFSKSSMIVDIDSASIVGVPFTKARGIIPYLGDKAPQILSVIANVGADLNQEMRVVQESPLKNTLGKDLAGMSLTGPMQLSLGLVVPLKHPENTKVKGVELITDATLNLPEWKLILDQINGSFEFTDDTLFAKNLHGKLFGETAVVNINTLQEGKHTRIRTDVTSRVSIANLEKLLNAPLSKYIQGSTDFNAQIYLGSHATGEGTHIAADTNLLGVAVDAPEPFGKTAQQAKNLKLDLDASAQGISKINIDYADLLTAGISLQSDKTYTVDLENAEIEGQIIVPADFHFSTLQGNFKRCYFKAATSTHEPILDPKSMPALNLTCHDLRYGSMGLGSITIVANPNGNGLQIRELRMGSPYYSLNASGEWDKTGKGSTSHLKGQTNSSNVSALLAELGFNAANLVASTGKVNFDLNWQGAPFKPALEGMDGQVSIKLGKGRIIELGSESSAKMGIGRMLNIFSLSSIPRRLTGDFSDISEKGYSFDSASGSFSLKNGSAYTQDTQLSGSIASLEINGRIGLSEKDYDLTLSVTPYITASLPIVATIAGGPIVGVATWVMDKVISAGVSKVVTYHYSVTGPWENPSWNQVGVNAAARPHQ